MRIEAILEWARHHHYTHLSRLVPYGQTAWTLYLLNATPEQLRRVQERIEAWDALERAGGKSA